jgi:hypothetical protein
MTLPGIAPALRFSDRNPLQIVLVAGRETIPKSAEHIIDGISEHTTAFGVEIK